MNKIFLTFCLACFAFFAQAQTLNVVNIASGFDSPVDITHAGDERLFIVERDGLIRIIDGGGTVLPTPFLDIDSQVTSGGGSSEIGLLGLAFHPDYANNGYFFVNYTATGGGDTRISRFSVNATNPNIADMSSEVVIMTIEQPYGNHNGGGIKFGPDGYLYIGTGDGGSGGDPGNRSQNPQTLLGKMLRIDIDNGTPYSVPDSNPFVGDASTLDEIWALGLRNPWRFSFDKETGDMWIGDVGQNAWEEIDFQPASSTGGENYGWRCYEAGHDYNLGTGCGSIGEYAGPVAEYTNSFSVGCSVTGGFVYRGCNYPLLYGKYIYGDYCSGRIWMTDQNGANSGDNDHVYDFNNNQISSFGEDINGELYMAALSQGIIYKLVETTQPFTIESTITDEACAGDNNGAITLTVDNSASITWSNGMMGPVLENLPAGPYTATVTSATGCVQTLTYEVSNTPIATPIVSSDNTDMPTLSVSNSGEFTSFQWFLDGTPINGATEATFMPNMSGDYTVLVSNDVDCTTTSEGINVVISDIRQLEGVASMSYAPNPIKDVFSMNIFTDKKVKIEVQIVDVKGQIMQTKSAEIDGNWNETFQLSALPAGVYFLSVRTENGEWTEKIMKNGDR